MQYGRMKTDLHLLSTSLRLRKGEIVSLLPATNLPQGGYFARPANGKWADGTIASDNMIAYSVCCEQGGLYDIGNVAKDIAIGLKQECVYVEHCEITMELITP